MARFDGASAITLSGAWTFKLSTEASSIVEIISRPIAAVALKVADSIVLRKVLSLLQAWEQDYSQ
jgi:hypothetical protein